MQAAASAGIPFLVLDRPNPLGGEYISGFVLDDRERSFVGQYNIPVAHGMTVAELAQFIVGEKLLPGLEGLELAVRPMLDWERWMRWRDISEVWIPTSPNISTYEAALLYPGIGFFEATSISEGRGTDLPFRLLGAGWMDQHSMATQLNQKNLPGVLFEAVQFMPQSSKRTTRPSRFEGQLLNGIKIVITDYRKVMPVELGIIVLDALREHARKKGQPELVNNVPWLSKLAGTRRLYEKLSNQRSAEEIIASWKNEVESFKARRDPYLLYK